MNLFKKKEQIKPGDILFTTSRTVTRRPLLVDENFYSRRRLRIGELVVVIARFTEPIPYDIDLVVMTNDRMVHYAQSKFFESDLWDLSAGEICGQRLIRFCLNVR